MDTLDRDVDSWMDILEGHFESNHSLLRQMVMKMIQGKSQSLSQFATNGMLI